MLMMLVHLGVIAKTRCCVRLDMVAIRFGCGCLRRIDAGRASETIMSPAGCFCVKSCANKLGKARDGNLVAHKFKGMPSL